MPVKQFPDRLKKFLPRKKHSASLEDSDTYRVELSRAMIAPLRFHPGHEHKKINGWADTGVYDAKGRSVQHSLLVRGGKKLSRAGDFKVEQDDNRKVIYCGRWVEHFGHFILEGIPNLWCAKDYKGYALAWSADDNGEMKVATWQADIIRMLAGDRDVILVTKPTRFAKVVVPNPGFRIPKRFSPVLADHFEKEGYPHQPVRGHKLWLSRSQVDNTKGLLNAPVLDRHLGRAGWQIAYPEKLSILEQLALLAKSESIAGEEGSALHLLILLSKARRLEVNIIPRLSSASRVRPHYSLIADVKGFTQNLHDIPGEIQVEDGGRHPFKKIAKNFAPHLDALGVPVENYELPHTNPISAIDDDFVDAARQSGCVQVGGDSEMPIAGVETSRKILISDAGSRDPRGLHRLGIDAYEMSPEQYLNHFHPSDLRLSAAIFHKDVPEDIVSEFRSKVLTPSAEIRRF